MDEGARLESVYPAQVGSRVRIPPSPKMRSCGRRGVPAVRRRRGDQGPVSLAPGPQARISPPHAGENVVAGPLLEDPRMRGVPQPVRVGDQDPAETIKIYRDNGDRIHALGRDGWTPEDACKYGEVPAGGRMPSDWRRASLHFRKTERVRFELTRPARAQRFSRPSPSSTWLPLH